MFIIFVFDINSDFMHDQVYFFQSMFQFHIFILTLILLYYVWLFNAEIMRSSHGMKGD